MAQVLVADDHLLLQRSVAQRLEAAGHSVATVGDGLAALMEVRMHRYDALICDVMLPNLDGLELFAQLQAEFPDVARHVVFVTAWADGPRVGWALQQSGCPVLEKPLDLDAVVLAVERLVARN